MSTFTFREITDFTSDSGQDFDTLRALHAISCDLETKTFGHDDFVESFENWRAPMTKQEFYLKPHYAIYQDGVVVGGFNLGLPRKDNKNLAYVWPWAQNQDAEILEYALTEAEKIALSHSRTTLINYTDHSSEPEESSPHALVAPTGIGIVDVTEPAVAARLSAGWKLEQGERYSVLDLPAPAALLTELEAQAASKASGDYHLISWQDRTPEEFIAGHCTLQQAMSTDAPSAGLDVEGTDYTPQRLAHFEDSLNERGRGYLVVAAQHNETGEIAGFTRVEYELDNPVPVFQEETLVLNAHRGHSLGMWVKAAMLQQLTQLRPDAQRLHTWNAGENSYMLNINVALGFTKRGISSAWQKKLS